MNIVEGETEVQATSGVLLFGKYEMTGIGIRDGGLAKYIDLTPVAIPHTGGKHANRSFGKSKVSIVERLINNLMRTEVFTGKKAKSLGVVKDAFEIIATKTKKNPVQVLVAKTSQGAGILGVIDGFSPKGVESDSDKADRIAMLRKFGYKA